MLRRCAFIYITLPLFCFLIGWLKWYWVILSCAALIACLLFSDKNNRILRLLTKENKTIDSPANEGFKLIISKWKVFAIAAVSCVYCVFCGIGRLWAQSDDYTYRNALFRDLILRDWPVFYDKYDGALAYYIGMWLPPAIPGKLTYLISGNPDTAFFAGNISLLIYFTIGFTLLFLLLLLVFRTAKTKQILLIMIGFFLFSGMDIIGNRLSVDGLHIEWWAGFGTFQYSSFTTCICWVFNQTLIPWICTVLLLHEKTVSNYVMIGMACLLCGPFPFVGFFIYCVAIAIKRIVDMIKAGTIKSFVKEAASVSNICAALFIFPFIGSYLTSNTFMSNTTVEETVSNTNVGNIDQVLLLIFFLLIEFGIYAMLIAIVNKKNYLFYATILQLCFYPLINIGVYSDFTMRASIPALFMMYALCYQYLVNKSALVPGIFAAPAKSKTKKRTSSEISIPYVVLICFLIIGAVTPCVELARGVVQVQERGIDDISTDYIVTFNRESHPLGEDEFWPQTNFVALDYEDKPFYKYFARR